MPSRKKHELLSRIYLALLDEFGPQYWWPGESPFEVIVGAILTQNTNWGNVEKAIQNLKSARVLTPQGIHHISVGRLARLIRPAGYFNVKAKRIKNFIAFLFAEFAGDVGAMGRQPWPSLRADLLAVNGIGPETADSIL